MAIVTIDGNTFDVYADLDTANAYLAGSLNAEAWRDADDDTKSRALVTSTRQIDAASWQGAKTDEDQCHAFPRTGLTYRNGTAVDSSEIPLEVVSASIELAALLVDGTAAQNAANAASGTKRLKAGSVEIEYFRNIAGEYGAAIFPRSILDLIGYWLSGNSAGLTAGSEASGTCDKSIADRRYGVQHGF